MFVESVFDAAKMSLMISGFVLTFNFLANYSEPRPLDSLKFLGLRLLKLVPINVICLIYLIFVQYQIGSGPVWHLMHEITNKCTNDNAWIRNLLFINNFGFDPGLDNLKHLIKNSPNKNMTLMDFQE